MIFWINWSLNLVENNIRSGMKSIFLKLMKNNSFGQAFI